MKVLAMLLVLLPLAAFADDNRPMTLQVNEDANGSVLLRWKIQPNLDASQAPNLAAPAGCTSLQATRAWSDTLGHWRETRWQCSGGLADRTIAIDFPRAAPALATIARLQLAGADDMTTVLLQPGHDQLPIPAPREHRNVFAEFLRLGVEHVWRGVDHLLFIAGLIFIARTPRRVLATITGFTIAHSITLALAALGVLRLPLRAIEATIALSIILLAVEIAKGPRDTLTWRHPTAIASSFGLLHGLGFAAVLHEVGLPQQGLVTALLAFNLGIEAGQLMFAVPVLLLFTLARRLGAQPVQFGAQRIAGYAVGMLASYWMFVRLFA
jgi:hydrogenase/urease accessory protein HupE